MLSDCLFELREQLKKDIAHYSTEPFGVDYPNSQKENLIYALYHLQLAQMAFDSFEYPDNHNWDEEVKKEAMKRATKEFEDAVSMS